MKVRSIRSVEKNNKNKEIFEILHKLELNMMLLSKLAKEDHDKVIYFVKVKKNKCRF